MLGHWGKKIQKIKNGGQNDKNKIKRQSIAAVDYNEFNEKYNERDVTARKRMKELIDSDANKVTNVFSTLL